MDVHSPEFTLSSREEPGYALREPSPCAPIHTPAHGSVPPRHRTHRGFNGNTSGLSFGYMLVLIAPLLLLAASWEGAEALIHDQYYNSQV